ncbi:hypothetical protein PIB30_007062 [Stylosanthes scabra]|uniref:Secreted protein n=1 Tax=Stylosanthes scabra TaxID=79078 RepID=A0ABU6R3D2_9FABA|nr:hypothetical protein [Stylosanthes scabra]
MLLSAFQVFAAPLVFFMSARLQSEPQTESHGHFILRQRRVFNIYNMREFVVVDKRARVKPTQVRWCSTLIFRILNLVAEVVGKEDPRDLITQTGKETKRMAINLQDLETKF